LQQNQAIGADPVVAVAQPRDLRGLQLNLARAIVNQDEIVARRFHFGKVNDHSNNVTPWEGVFQVEITDNVSCCGGGLLGAVKL
jgi:hypothetical protein